MYLRLLYTEVFCLEFQSSGSGSGSRSDIQTQKCTKSKSGDNNNSGSNGRNGDTSMGLNARDGSDNGSGTQVRHFHVFTSSKFTTSLLQYSTQD